METVKYKYEANFINFEIDRNIMINATDMAKLFDKQVIAFMRNDDTQKFIKECLKSENSHFLGIEKEEDLYISKQKSGTWMHRVLALKFAAWLDSAFELWVYRTIDDLLFGSYREIIQNYAAMPALFNKKRMLKMQVRKYPEVLELARVNKTIRSITKGIEAFNPNQKPLQP